MNLKVIEVWFYNFKGFLMCIITYKWNHKYLAFNSPGYLMTNTVFTKLKMCSHFLSRQFLKLINESIFFWAVLDSQQNWEEGTEISHTCNPLTSITHQNEPTLTHHNHPKAIVYPKVHSWCCTFYGLGQMYKCFGKPSVEGIVTDLRVEEAIAKCLPRGISVKTKQSLSRPAYSLGLGSTRYWRSWRWGRRQKLGG